MEIHQFVHTLNYGDAISGEAITISKILREQGLGGEIFSVHAHEKVAHLTKNYANFPGNVSYLSEQRVAILHYSIASPLNKVYAELDGWKKVLVYHNLTPEKWFLGYNQRVVSDLRQGRAELPALAKLSDLIVADSEYNKIELEGFGIRNVDVLPLVLDTAKWSIPANEGIKQILKKEGEKNIVHVGRLAPNKCIEDIIKAFYFYHHKIEKKSRLWIVGIDIDTEIYSFELRRLVSELRLQEAVSFVGAVADSELRSFYEAADLYLCMSEHEGFCLPLVEAMYFGLPVIAYDACAVGDTVGAAGLLLKEKHPAKVAELMNILLTDPLLRSEVVRLGRQRARDFSDEPFQASFNRFVLEKLNQSFDLKRSPASEVQTSAS